MTRVEPKGTVRDRYLVQGPIAPRFVEAQAVTADDAIGFTPADAREARAFAAMIGDGSIRVARPGRFWFDMDAYEAAAAARRRRMLPLWIAGAVLAAVIAILFYRG